ncbi:MAG: GTPase HflX [Lachnospiraceae bacterium]|nr:GTPase HflX [Lachnospiraceae bacterium]
MIETQEKKEKVILVAVAQGDPEEAIASLEELEQLALTAGAEVAEMFLQSRDRPHPGTYLGSGKIEELKERLKELGADGIICDDELTPAQARNLEQLLDTKVMDRTLVILDIFAQRAHTREGKIQVELAQLRYRATRLTGKGTSLSRLGGGIGTRGPGESKLETDRRVIHARISVLKSELRDVVRHREVTREKRKQTMTPVLAIVGYTNAGKSTLLNTLTGAGILAEDKLFATLDPTTRPMALPGGEEVMLTDTVGFIRKLPHQLIDAFRSTLEEAALADMILHVADAGSPQLEEQMKTVYETLHELGADGKPVLTLFNKCDLRTGPMLLRDAHADRVLRISAKTGLGLDEMKAVIADMLQEQKVLIDRVFSYAESAKAALVHKTGSILSEEYLPEGIHIRAYVPKKLGL